MLKRALRSNPHLADPRSWIAKSIVWGGAVVVGLVIVEFAAISSGAFGCFADMRQRWPWMPLVVTPCVGMACAWLSRRWFPGTEGGGIPHVVAAARRDVPEGQVLRFVSVRIALAKVALVSAAFGAGFSVGREGPSVQVGAGLLHAVRRWMPEPFREHPRSLIIAGGAAGMAATFNTPLAGVVFAIEQLARRFDEGTNATLIAAIIWAGLVSLALLGNYTYFGRLVVPEMGFAVIPMVLLAGVACGVAGGLFNRLLLAVLAGDGPPARWLRRFPVICTGVCGLGVALIGIATDGATFGGGYDLDLYPGSTLPAWLYAAGRFGSTILSTVSALPGGLFGPSLGVGTAIGHALTPFGPDGLNVAAVTALCMAAYLAAVTDAPLTSFIVVMEMVDGHAMVLSLMAVAMIARLFSRLVSAPLYETLAERLATTASAG
jgi:H+/Cl- antiporter ClcA